VGYHLPPKKCITWPYIVQVLTGEKKLLKGDKLVLNRTLPRIKELSMKEVWPKFQNDQELISYFPDFEDGRNPPRLYFFQILSAIRANKFSALIKESKATRQKVAEQNNKLIAVDEGIWSSIKKASLHENLVTTSESKRIIMKTKKNT